ncbi:MAG: SHOCT domain-containing protein [Cyanobacteriota bacterium]|nr:SHOCT domain-containing protein [Cyanobacteriota bacterium]
MDQLTPEGLQVVNELALRYGFSQEAVIQMMFAMLRGRGAMAQFNHPEFAGSGQWMRGGMLMLGDMFNHSLKVRVDGLCQAIAAQLASQPNLFPMGSFQSQSQSGGGQQMQVGGGGQQMQVGGGGQQMQVSGAGAPPMAMPPLSPMTPLGEGGHGLFTPDPHDTWWPKELGTPSAIGAQNDVRYALFPAIGRLAVEANGQLTIHDTGDHQIAGFSQQQGSGGALVFTTPSGRVSLASLPRVGGGPHQQAQSSAGGDLQQQAQSSDGGSQQQVNAGMGPMTSLAPVGGTTPMIFTPMAPQEAWWPAELGTPSSSGAQNALRYAVFPAARCLAVDRNGRVSVHEIGDLQISGCSQANGEAEVHFTTNAGIVALSSLPEAQPAPPAASGAPAPSAETVESRPPLPQTAVLEALAKLGELKQMGILTEAEFAAKKAELLRRL